MKPTLIALAVASALFSFSALAETAVTVKDTELKKEPASDAPTLAKLPGKSQVEVLKRQGGWTQVKPATEPQGWVKLFDLKFGGEGSAKSSGGGDMVSSIFGGRSGSSGTTVTTGVKGLDADMIQNASPNPAEVKRMHSYSISKAEALQLAGSGKLSKQSIEYLGSGSGRSSSTSSSSSPWGETP